MSINRCVLIGLVAGVNPAAATVFRVGCEATVYTAPADTGAFERRVHKTSKADRKLSTVDAWPTRRSDPPTYKVLPEKAIDCGRKGR